MQETLTDSSTVDWWSDIKWFNRSEFRCQCGGKYCSGYPAEMSETLIRIADSIREECNAPAHVTSGLRCGTHNAEVGGVSNSAHITGKAMDFYVSGMTAAALLAKVNKHVEIKYAYAINDRTIHMNV